MGRCRVTAGDEVRDGAMSFYDALAPYYREYATARAAYLSAVDRFVVERASRPVTSLLDVGAGDGVRGAALASRLGAGRVVLCEPSREMAALCRTLGSAEVWETPAESMPVTATPFDVVLCLWNVLGHLPDRARRLAALRAIRRLVAPRGAVFLDVNNRHNAAAYGRMRVAFRRLADCIAPDERRGDAAFTWRVAGVSVPGMGHLFTPAEIEGLIAAAGLRIAHRVAVDYLTGASSPSPFRGQLLYELRA